MTTSLFPNGLTNARETVALGACVVPDMTRVHQYYDDFDTYTAGDWVVTEVGVATQALSDADNGVLLVTNAAADDDSSFSQKVGESFLFESGKKLWFKSRFKVSDVTQSDLVIGLQITDTTPLAVTDGVFFIKSDGAATVDMVVEKDSTATTTSSVATLADDTWVELAYFYNGVDRIDVFVDDSLVANSVVTNLPDDEVLTLSFGIQNGEAVAKTMSVDYLLAIKER
jgi:hypothetical protein